MSPVNIPYWNQESSPSGTFPSTPGNTTAFPSSTLDKIYYSNYGIVSSIVAASIAIRSQYACSYWFGSDYPYGISVYEPNPKTTGAALRDASFLAEPISGWMNLLSQYALGNTTYVNATTQLVFSKNQQNSWYVNPSCIQANYIGILLVMMLIMSILLTSAKSQNSQIFHHLLLPL